MMSFIQLHAGAFVTTGAVLLAIFVVSARARARHLRLMRNLELANLMLQQHTAAVREFADDERLPPEIRLDLLGFSEAIFDEGEFMRTLAVACDQNTKRDIAALHEREAEIAACDVNLLDLFRTAVSTAIVCMLLKTQGATVMLDDYLARVAADETEKALLFSRMRRRPEGRPPTEPSGALPLPA